MDNYTVTKSDWLIEGHQIPKVVWEGKLYHSEGGVQDVRVVLGDHPEKDDTIALHVEEKLPNAMGEEVYVTTEDWDVASQSLEKALLFTLLNTQR